MTDLHEILGASVPSTTCLCCPSPRVTGLQVCQECWDARQPGGAATQVDPVIDRMCADVLARSRVGIKKYGTTLARTDLTPRDWMQHLYEELLDAAAYAKRQILDMDAE